MADMIRIVDQTSPWVGVVAPVVATLPNGDVRARVSELVIVGLVAGEFQPYDVPRPATYPPGEMHYPYDEPEDVGGVYDGLGHVYSDADPGL